MPAMAAGVYNITIEQGSTFTLNLTWKDSSGAAINITGYTARMQVRKSVDAASTTLSLTSGAGDITLGGAAGTISITVSAASTASIASGNYVYDLELVSGAGVVTRLLQGAVTVSPEVTR